MVTQVAWRGAIRRLGPEAELWACPLEAVAGIAYSVRFEHSNHHIRLLFFTHRQHIELKLNQGLSERIA